MENLQFDHTISFDKLVTDYRHRFIFFANNYVDNWVVAEDIVTDALMYYWENRQKLSDDANVLAYVLTTVKHKCLNHLYHLDTRERVATHLFSNAEWDLSMRIASLENFEPSEIFTNEIKEIVNRTVESMPEQTRNIFILSRYRYKSNKDIANELGISVKTVEFHMSKALKILRIELKDYFPLLLFFYL